MVKENVYKNCLSKRLNKEGSYLIGTTKLSYEELKK